MILRKETHMTTTEFIQFLMERFHIEWKRRDHSGIYGLTQRLLAYNSNKIVFSIPSRAGLLSEPLPVFYGGIIFGRLL